MTEPDSRERIERGGCSLRVKLRTSIDVYDTRFSAANFDHPKPLFFKILSQFLRVLVHRFDRHNFEQLSARLRKSDAIYSECLADLFVGHRH